MADLLKQQDQVIVFGMETAGYGLGTALTGSDAILARDLSVTMLESSTEERNNIVGFMGGQGSITTERKITAGFGCEFATSGTANIAPKWGKLLRACGFAQVISANSVTYTCVSNGFESASAFYRLNKVKQVLNGMRGKVVLNLDAQSIPNMAFDFESLFSDPTLEATVLTGVDLSAFKKPLATTEASATVTFLGTEVNMSKLTVDPGITVQFVSGTESEQVEIVSRKGTVSLSFRTSEQALINAVKNASDNAEGELNYVIGSQVGETLTVNVPNLQVKTAALSWDGEIANVDITADIKPLTANTDLIISQS